MMKIEPSIFSLIKREVGSTKNGRDSESKRLGAKRADGQFVKDWKYSLPSREEQRSIREST